MPCFNSRGELGLLFIRVDNTCRKFHNSVYLLMKPKSMKQFFINRPSNLSYAFPISNLMTIYPGLLFFSK